MVQTAVSVSKSPNRDLIVQQADVLLQGRQNFANQIAANMSAAMNISSDYQEVATAPNNIMNIQPRSSFVSSRNTNGSKHLTRESD